MKPRVPLLVSPLDRTTVFQAWDIVRSWGGDSPLLFRLAGDQLVAVVNDNDAIRLRGLTVPTFRAYLDTMIASERMVRDGPTPCFVPTELAMMMFHDPECPLPFLRRLVTVPVFGVDGSLRTTAGYSEHDQLFLAPSFEPLEVPDNPSASDIAEARRIIDEVLADFPFASAADSTAAVALLLLPFVRDMIDGPTPLYLVEASTPGAGKGLLTTVCLIPALGRIGAASVALPDSDDELRKLITSQFSQGVHAIVFDNVNHLVRSGVLAKALTEWPFWSDRLLGSNTQVTLPARAIWCMTANNPQLSDELARRVVPIRLVPDSEKPEERTGFRHPELRTWAFQNRARLVWAAHILVRHWIRLGQPGPDTETPLLGSFEAYRAVIGGILGAAGYADFLGNRERLRAFSDADTEAWRPFVDAWAQQFGDYPKSTADLLPLATECGISIRGHDQTSRVSSLGTLLGKRRERVFGGWRIMNGSGSDRRKWCLKRAADTPDTSDTLSLLEPAPGSLPFERAVNGDRGDSGVDDWLPTP